MLDNTRKGFAEEILLVITLDIITGILLSITYSKGMHTIGDYFMAFVVPLLIYFPSVRLFRYAFVYHAYVVLYSMYSFFIIVLLFAGIDVMDKFTKHNSDFIGSFSFFLVIFGALILYTAYIFIQRKKGLFKKTVPPERIQTLRMVLTPKQKLTLIFPDRYIKFLETGDGRYKVNK